MSETNSSKLTEALRRRTTGIIMAVALVVLWFLQGWPLRIGFMAVMVLSIDEMHRAFIHRGAKPVRWVGIAYALASMPAYLFYGSAAIAPLTALMCMLGLMCIVFRGEVDFDAIIATLIPLIYPGLLITLMFPIQDIQPPLFATVALGLCFLIAVANDLAAYEVGRRFGKTPLCPNISPKKTVEGAVAGLVGSVLISVLLPLIAEWVTVVLPIAQPYNAQLPPLWHFAILGLLGGVASPVGDLTASMVKRHCGIKDFGSIFPGHGGMLDRVDSVVFSGAVVYIYFILVLRAF